jgi:hypothetical protein
MHSNDLERLAYGDAMGSYKEESWLTKMHFWVTLIAGTSITLMAVGRVWNADGEE